ncbi:Protein STRUBBELIG-RECEPTOR FAMILY 3 [Triticum urartu]|uniref:Protein STRUBBELIG-RECEPTOR FAMILY 3 n=1 Tax=Triticum urartu TaxID=4572 RepID=M7Z057_TRIUA|nr:Protein STRUBBELIG-RECEPTOR FAMILY 3 [Triticum urartu]
MELRGPQDLQTAMYYARAFERRAVAVQQESPSRATGSLPWPDLAQGRPAQASAAPLAATEACPFRWLTSAELLERRHQGLCFNCDEPYTPGHVCPRLFYLEVADYIPEDAVAADLAAPAVAKECREQLVFWTSTSETREHTDLQVQVRPLKRGAVSQVWQQQQYTSNFREQNVIRESRLGKVFLAELPEGKLLEVMKIDNPNGRVSVDDFLELVALISEIKHPNTLELVGYCAEYGQRLLVYNHFSRKTLDDALHDREEIDIELSWNARLQVALSSGKALEYLHESFQPPIVHQNFEPANVLLDDKLSVCVAECGLAELMPSSSVTQLSGRLRTLLNYDAPEFQESGIISERGDVYSFGVVMLELLTGRKPYDSSRPRHEQHLVRWAGCQLHDIESLSKMVDPSIRGQCSEKVLSRFADIISRCIQREPEFRPPVSAVVQDITSIVNASREESE